MAYDRNEMSRKVAEVEKELAVDGKPALVKDVVAEVAKRKICGIGVAYQVVAHLRKAEDEAAKEAEEARSCACKRRTKSARTSIRS